MEIIPSALKHGVSLDDIDHAVECSLAVDEIGEDPLRFLVLGPDLNGNLLELVIVDDARGPRVIQAMRMREQYKSLLQGGAR